MSAPVAKALWSHYKRHPFQVLLVWLGLTLGIALLVGVMVINQHARQSYHHSERLFSSPFSYVVMPRNPDSKMPQGAYISLRRHGFSQCVPYDYLDLKLAGDKSVRLMGLDTVAMLPFWQADQVNSSQASKMPMMLKSPYPVIASPDTAKYLGVADGDVVRLADGKALGKVTILDDRDMGVNRLVGDMALLRSLSPSSNIAGVLCGKMTDDTRQRLMDGLPPGLMLDKTNKAHLDPLTRAFHTNLFATGLLAFVVGLFVFYQAISLSFAQRQPLVGLLRQLGVDNRQLLRVTSVEMFVWLLFGVIGGNLVGLWLAKQLLPSVSSTLNDLYGANVGIFLQWKWEWGIYSFALAAVGFIAASIWPLMRLLRTPPTRLAQRMALIRFTGQEFYWQALAACVLVLAALAVSTQADSLNRGFVLIALIVLSAGLLAPYLMWKLFVVLGTAGRSARRRWFFSDAASSLSYRGVAAVAFMLAISANIAMETMVGSFRETTDQWLQQRLSADIYIRPNAMAAGTLIGWLDAQPEVDAVWQRWWRRMPTDKGPVELVSIGTTSREREALPVKNAGPEYWRLLHTKKTVLISESMALGQHLSVGDYVNLPNPFGAGWKVAGVYHDYGNPYGQVLISERQKQMKWLIHTGRASVAVNLRDDVDTQAFVSRMEKRFEIPSSRITDYTTIHDKAMKLFERTFAITESISTLTLVVASVGLFFATLASEFSRQRQFALLRCIGMSGRSMAWLGGGQLLVIGVVSGIFALPLGILLAHLMVDVLLKHSFGWTMDVIYFPVSYAVTLSCALIALLVAGAWPVLRLIKRSALVSLRESS